LYSGPCTCQTNPLLLEPDPIPFLL
jgi:hypothetical protein